MPLRSDIQDVIEVIFIANLGNVVSNQTIAVPPGIGDLINTTVRNNLGNLGLPPDITNVVDTFVLTNPNAFTTST